MEAVKPAFDTRHFILPAEGRLTEILPSLLELSTERVSELLHLGSVYLNKKRVLEDQVVAALSYLRVHCLPKRYETSNVDWNSCIVFENEHALVVNKPSGFPVPSAVDNVRETVVAQMQKVTKNHLYVTQRLDVLSSGLMVFAKTREFQKAYNYILSEGLLYKEYFAKTAGGPALGLHKHYMKPSFSAPKEVFASAESLEWKECRLEVLATEPKGDFFETKIRLLTGRTHQIRAQMKALNCPLWGDKLYSAPGPQSEYKLTSKALKFYCPLTQQNLNFEI